MEMNQPEDFFFSELLKQFRKRKKLNQKQLAERIEVSRETVSLWERGEYKPEAERILYKIVEVLGLTAQEQQQLFEAYTVTALATSFHNPPFERNPYFTGRNLQLTNLHALLIKGKQVALTQAISGLGGIGKTQLALEYAYRYQKSYHDIFWVTANTYDSLMSSYVQLAALLHLPEYNEQDQNKVKMAVQQWLSEHRGWLLILDNIEDLNLVHQFIPKDRQGAVLFTTRRRVTEPVAQALELEVLPENDAILFLLKRAKVLTLEMSLRDASDHDIGAARAITQLLGNLPLALDQAGAYILEAQCGLTGYQNLYLMRRAEMLKERGNLIDDDPEPDYPETVATTWLISFQKVEQKSPAAAELLLFCAFLAPDAIPEEIITNGGEHLGPLLLTIAGNPLALNKAIAVLSAYSLINRNMAEKTLSIHRLVQAVQRDVMTDEEIKLWTERTVLAVNATFPKPEFAQWVACERCLPHAQVCADLVKQEGFMLPEAAFLLSNGGIYLHDRGRYSEAEPLLVLALRIREQQLGEMHLDTAISLNNLAILSYAQGKYEQAEPLLVLALKIREQQLGEMHPSTAACLHNLAELYRAQGKYEQAEPLHVRALSIYEQQLGTTHPSTATSLDNLAELYRAQGKYERAEPLYVRALSIYEQQLGTTHPDIATSLHNLAELYRDQGKYEQAEPLYMRALSIYEQQLGVTHPYTATSLHDLAGLYSDQGKYEQAEPLYVRVLSIYEQQLGEMHPYTAACLHNLAGLYSDQGKYEQAETLYVRVLSIDEQQLGEMHPDTASCLNNLAGLYRTQGKYEQAETLYVRALSIYEQQLGEMHPNTAASLNNLASLYTNQGKYKFAEPLYQRALTIYEKALGLQHPDTQRARQNYTTLLQTMGRHDEAEQLDRGNES
jgi:tetratricopeptide (TPR) repeat protein